MTRKLQILRGTTAQNDAYIGSIGELTMDTEKVEVRIHDGITQGGKKIGSGGANLPILTHVFSDHIINDISWLRADTFSWQSGDVYVSAYEHLVDDLESSTISNNVALVVANGIEYYRNESSDVTGAVAYPYAWSDSSGTTYYSNVENLVVGNSLSSSTSEGGAFITVAAVYHEGYDNINDIKIEYYAAPDGHKICLPDQESNISALYEATGVAWYYILDTTNKQFKLPRTKFGFTGLRDSVGGYVAPGLPNITGSVGYTVGVNTSATGAFTKDASVNSPWWQGSTNVQRASVFHLDASRSSPIYGNSDTVQSPATQMYLYFYVGNFEQSAIEQTAGINTELFNDKADSDLKNIPANYDYVVESQTPTAENGYTWYRKYKSGWVEQGGLTTNNESTTNNLAIPMADTNYVLIVMNKVDGRYYSRILSMSTTGFVADPSVGSNTKSGMWQVSGMSS